MDYKPGKIPTQVFDAQMKAGNMLVSGKITLYAIRATKDRPDGTEHRPFFARESHGPWNDSIKHAELWSSLDEVRATMRAVNWTCSVEPVRVHLFIGRVESA